MTRKVKRDPLHPLSLFSGNNVWVIVGNNENTIASGFEDDAVALSHLSLLETNMSETMNSEVS
jgi:hypothetical protein